MYWQAYSSRGGAKGYIEDYQGAIEDFNKAIRINPSDDKSYYGRGLAKIVLNQKESGCSDLQRALKLGNPQAKETILKYCH
ncbi:MAG: tetratricopeptide repeat protein [Bacteroidales bacterium]